MKDENIYLDGSDDPSSRIQMVRAKYKRDTRVMSEMSRKRFARSVYLTKSSEKITRVMLCTESIRREVGEPIKDFKASRANDPVM